MGHTHAKKQFVVYLKFKFMWASCIFIGWSRQPWLQVSPPGQVCPAATSHFFCGFLVLFSRVSTQSCPTPFSRLPLTARLPCTGSFFLPACPGTFHFRLTSPVLGRQCGPTWLSQQSCVCPLRPGQHSSIHAARGFLPAPAAAQPLPGRSLSSCLSGPLPSVLLAALPPKV